MRSAKHPFRRRLAACNCIIQAFYRDDGREKAPKGTLCRSTVARASGTFSPSPLFCLSVVQSVLASMAELHPSSMAQAADNRVARFLARCRARPPYPLVTEHDGANLRTLVDAVLSASEECLLGKSFIPSATNFSVEWDSARVADDDAEDVMMRVWTVSEYKECIQTSDAIPSIHMSARQWAALTHPSPSAGGITQQSAVVYSLRFKLRAGCRASSAALGYFQLKIPSQIEDVSVDVEPDATYMTIWLRSSNIWPVDTARMTAFYTRERVAPVMTWMDADHNSGFLGYIRSAVGKLFNPPQTSFDVHASAAVAAAERAEDDGDSSLSAANGFNPKKRKLGEA